MADVSASAVAVLERMHPLRHDLNVPDYETSDAGDALGQHIRGFFAGHKIAKRTWPLVPIETRIPGFFVYEIEPGPRFPGWTYVSSGCWRATAEHGHRLGFVVSARNGRTPPRGRDSHARLRPPRTQAPAARRWPPPADRQAMVCSREPRSPV